MICCSTIKEKKLDVLANCCGLRRGVVMVTTSKHDPVNGYFPTKARHEFFIPYVSYNQMSSHSSEFCSACFMVLSKAR